jgi:hypothetical protein
MGGKLPPKETPLKEKPKNAWDVDSNDTRTLTVPGKDQENWGVAPSARRENTRGDNVLGSRGNKASCLWIGSP